MEDYKLYLHGLKSKGLSERKESLEKLFELLEIDSSNIPDWFMESLLSDPASTRFHGDYPGGLLEHSANVALTLMYFEHNGITNFHKKRSPVVVGLLHDLCKVGTYISEQGLFSKNTEELWKGHATKTLCLLSTDMFGGFKLTEQEALCIRYHMGAYEIDEWDAFAQAIHKYPEVLFTHTADMYATHVLGV